MKRRRWCCPCHRPATPRGWPPAPGSRPEWWRWRRSGRQRRRSPALCRQLLCLAHQSASVSSRVQHAPHSACPASLNRSARPLREPPAQRAKQLRSRFSRHRRHHRPQQRLLLLPALLQCPRRCWLGAHKQRRWRTHGSRGTRGARGSARARAGSRALRAAVASYWLRNTRCPPRCRNKARGLARCSRAVAELARRATARRAHSRRASRHAAPACALPLPKCLCRWLAGAGDAALRGGLSAAAALHHARRLRAGGW